MRLKSLHLENFRNYPKLELNFPKENNLFIICGENGQGKTNILEAIYLLATTKSFRAAEPDSLCRSGEDYFQITGAALKNDQEVILQTVCQIVPGRKISKVHKVNGVKKRGVDFIGQLIVSLFTAEDLNMILHEPALRRKYLDNVLSMISRAYLQDLGNYRAVIKNRNRVLKNIRLQKGDRSELMFWNEKIADIGIIITKERQNLVSNFEEIIGDYYRRISENEHRLSIRYEGGMKGLTKEQVLQELEKRLERDMVLESTTFGPHHDDVKFYLNNRELKSFSSRGEIRSAILALKFSEIEFMEKMTGFKPVLLLDDVFSELDQRREELLMNMIINYQTILTTARDKELKEIAQVLVWKCLAGTVEK